jgi:Lipase (class 3)
MMNRAAFLASLGALTPAVAVRAAAATYVTEPTWKGATFLTQSIQAHRSKVDGVNLIAFRGSRRLGDWWLDFQAQAREVVGHGDLNTRVHAGFLTAAQSIAPAIAADIGAEAYAPIGHSLGGALALLLPVLMPRRPVAIFAYAPPRVFADEVPGWILACARAWRFGNDPVPDQPGWFPHVPVEPIGRATPDLADAAECHHIENYVNALV